MSIFRKVAPLALAALLTAGVAVPAAADRLIGSYWAFIGRADLYNSKGQRLSAPWQVLRQDRANVHRFGISQPGDEWDPFFGSIENRAIMERMIMQGSITKRARQIVMGGGAIVHVRIYGSGNTGTRLVVDVSK